LTSLPIGVVGLALVLAIGLTLALFGHTRRPSAVAQPHRIDSKVAESPSTAPVFEPPRRIHSTAIPAHTHRKSLHAGTTASVHHDLHRASAVYRAGGQKGLHRASVIYRPVAPRSNMPRQAAEDEFGFESRP
jgi:hypothetical protein